MKLVKLACPYCFTELPDSSKCRSCSFVIIPKEGYIEMHRDDNSWEFCESQIKAVRVLEKADQGGYSEIPSSEEVVPNEHQLMLEKSLEVLGDLTGKILLDLGGKGGYCANFFLNHGAKGVVVLDIDRDQIIKENDKIMSIIGDGYYMPIANEQFDFVFDSASLHHFEHKTVVLKQIDRVLKPGGKYISIGNPPRQGADDDDRKRYWKDHGLLETMATKSEYEQYFTEVFGHVNFISVAKNMIMYINKGC